MSEPRLMTVMPLKYAAREKIPAALMSRAVIFATVLYCSLQGVGMVITVLIPAIFSAAGNQEWLISAIVSAATALSHLSVVVLGMAWLYGRDAAEPLWVPLALNIIIRVINLGVGLFFFAGDSVLASPTPVRNFSIVAAGGHILQGLATLVLPVLAIWVLRRPEERHAR